MTDTLTLHLQALARDRIAQAGLEWASLEKNTSQIIVFGSFALGAATEVSDLDILCIGVGKRVRTEDLHLLWVSEERTRSARWLESELATHVAAYGKWIKGNNSWAFRTVPGPDALIRKREKICLHALAMERHWNDLADVFQRSHMDRLRRNLQRFVMMKAGKPPVPKVFLDDEWINWCARESLPFRALCECVPAVPNREFLLKAFGQLARGRDTCGGRLRSKTTPSRNDLKLGQ